MGFFKKFKKIIPKEINPRSYLPRSGGQVQANDGWNPNDQINQLQTQLENQRKLYEDQLTKSQQDLDRTIRYQEAERNKQLSDLRDSMNSEMVRQRQDAELRYGLLQRQAEERQKELQAKAEADLAAAEKARQAQEEASRNRQAYLQSFSAAQSETQVKANRDNSDEQAQAGKMPNPVNDENNPQRKRRLGGRPTLLGSA